MTEYERLLERKRSEHGDRFVEPWGVEKFASFLHSGIRIRVRTTYPSGDVEERTGTVGITSGWRPAFLLMHRSSDHGSWDTIDERDEITAVRWNGHDYEPVSGPAYKAIGRSPTTPSDPTPEPVSQAVFQDVSAPENPTPGYPSPFTHVRPATKRPGEGWMVFGDPRPLDQAFILNRHGDSVGVVGPSPNTPDSLILVNAWQTETMPAPAFHYYMTVSA